MSEIRKRMKLNRLTSSVYNRMLDLRCKDVRAYVFVATTGRSGSESLAKIFGAVPDSVCLHEPYPIMVNDCPEGVDPEKYFDDLFYLKKRINIKRTASRYRYYMETNHLFFQNFLERSVETFGDRIRIIHMVRNPVSVGSSFYSIQSIPGTTKNGKLYLIDPAGDDNLIMMNDMLGGDGEFGHDLYKCLWYWYESEARIRKLKERYPHVSWYRLETEELNDNTRLLDMFNILGIPVDAQRLQNLVGTRVNVKTDQKRKSLSLDDCRAFDEKLRGKIRERYGIEFLTGLYDS